jgi:predicted ATP-binding protein involved in virulence
MVMAVRIKGIEIDGIGTFNDFKMEFPEKKDLDKAEIHIFTGENGTGKTTLLEVLVSVFTTVPILGVKRNKLLKEKSATATIFFSKNGEIDSGTVGINEKGQQLNYYKDDTSFVNEFFLKFKNIDDAITICPFAYSGMKSLRQVNIDSIKELQDNPIEQSASFNKKLFSETLLQWILNVKTKASLAETEGESKRFAESYRKAIENIEEIVSEITGWKIEFAINIRRLGVYLSVDGVVMSFDVLPDGLKSILAWIADMLMRIDRINWATDENPFERNLIVALDEIDIHLHPAWQRRILPVLQRYFINSQFFISTHSPFVVGSVDGAWVYRLKREGQQTILLNGEPLLSEDAKSYSLLLEEVFGIAENFGIAVEEKLASFYKMKKEVLGGVKALNDKELLQLVQELSNQSEELNSIIGMEMRQLNRLKTSAPA